MVYTLAMRTILILFLFLTLCSAAPAVSLTGIAAGTTIAVNAGNIAKWVRHPKREAVKTAKQVKAVVKGKN
jgi:hypothetical protein